MSAPDELAGLIVRTIKRALEPLAVRLAAVEGRRRGARPLRERLAATEARLAVADALTERQAAALEAAGGRLAALEARPGLEPLGPLREALAAAEGRLAAILPGLEALGLVRERVASLEARPAVPGPVGPAGADGLGFDDLAVTFDGAHTLTLRFTAGERVKEFPITLPFLRDCGIHHEGRTLRAGRCRHVGRLAVARREGDDKPAGPRDLGGRPGVLAVKGGRDGRPGATGERGPVGPAGKDWQQVFDATRAAG